MTAVPRTLVNGVPGDAIAVADRGFQYGDGVFETIAVARGAPLLWERHLARLLEGCARLGFTDTPDAGRLSAEARELCRGAGRAVLKLIVTRGAAGRGYAPPPAMPTRVVQLLAWPDEPPAYARTGVDLRFCATRLGRNPRLAGIKHLNRLEQVLARAEWGGDCAEGLMLDDHDGVIEGTRSNLFTVARGDLLTPDLSQCGVAGVMRALVLEQAAARGLRCRIARVTRAEVEAADELFLTNSLIGIWPVRRLENRDYGIGEITQTLQTAIAPYQCFSATD